MIFFRSVVKNRFLNLVLFINLYQKNRVLNSRLFLYIIKAPVTMFIIYSTGGYHEAT